MNNRSSYTFATLIALLHLFVMIIGFTIISINNSKHFDPDNFMLFDFINLIIHYPIRLLNDILGLDRLHFPTEHTLVHLIYFRISNFFILDVIFGTILFWFYGYCSCIIFYKIKHRMKILS